MKKLFSVLWRIPFYVVIAMSIGRSLDLYIVEKIFFTPYHDYMQGLGFSVVSASSLLGLCWLIGLVVIGRDLASIVYKRHQNI